MKKYRKLIYITLVLISLVYFSVTPVGVDMPFHVMRIGELAKELSRGGGFPVYIYRDLYSHYGYPVPMFYCSLFLYPFALLSLCGLPAITAYKLMIVCVLWAIYGVTVYCFHRIPGLDAIRLEAAFIYTIQPFVLNELFVRSSVGSACAFIFLPIVMLGLYYMFCDAETDSTGLKSVLRCGICLGGGMAGIIMSHVISAVLISMMIVVIYVVFLVRKKNRIHMILEAIVSVFICILMSAWYVFPVLEQFAGQTFKSQAVTWLQIGAENSLSILFPMHLITLISHLFHVKLPVSEIGGASVPILVLTIYLLLTRRLLGLQKTEKRVLTLYYVLYIALLIPYIWVKLGPALGFMQFGWRVFLIITLIGTAFCVLLMKHYAEDDTLVRVIMTISVCSAVYVLIFMFGYYGAREIAPELVGEKLGHAVSGYTYESETADNLYIPAMMDEKVLSNRDRIAAITGKTTNGADEIEYTCDIDEKDGTVNIVIDRNASMTPIVMEIPFIYYKGYVATNPDTDVCYEVIKGDDCLVNIVIPAEETGHISVGYKGTLVQYITFLISIISSVLLVIVVHEKIH